MTYQTTIKTKCRVCGALVDMYDKKIYERGTTKIHEHKK